MEIPDTTRLIHAYGFATDTAGHLQALAGEDEAAQDAAIDHLANAIMHQGTPWPATGPVAEYVVDLLVSGTAHERVADALLDFLDEVLDAIEQAEREAGEITIRGELESLNRDLAAELEGASTEEDVEALFEDEGFDNLVMLNAFLGILAVAPAIREVLED